ncbi:hypothetical protein GCM10027299_20180 [Larkinella ripae]
MLNSYNDWENLNKASTPLMTTFASKIKFISRAVIKLRLQAKQEAAIFAQG